MAGGHSEIASPSLTGDPATDGWGRLRLLVIGPVLHAVDARRC
jgi:hypothetical protein